MCYPGSEELGNPVESPSCLGLWLVIIAHERGIPSKCKSSACADYVPALCTHRPSLLPIEWFTKVLRLVSILHASVRSMVEKKAKLDHLEEVKVVTRFP